MNRLNRLNPLGIGPRIAIILLPWLAASIILSRMSNGYFEYSARNSHVLHISGIVLMGVGLVFYFATVRLLLKGLKETRLITSGPYRFCRNPLYVSLIILIIPALSLILNSWLVLTSSIVGFLLFKLFIKSENKELEKFFGEDYLKYKKETPEFFPFLHRTLQGD
jgi:protein-S-isoprenylcysteine O-methyltransferase Ste14